MGEAFAYTEQRPDVSVFCLLLSMEIEVNKVGKDYISIIYQN